MIIPIPLLQLHHATPLFLAEVQPSHASFLAAATAAAALPLPFSAPGPPQAPPWHGQD